MVTVFRARRFVLVRDSTPDALEQGPREDSAGDAGEQTKRLVEKFPFRFGAKSPRQPSCSMITTGSSSPLFMRDCPVVATSTDFDARMVVTTRMTDLWSP